MSHRVVILHLKLFRRRGSSISCRCLSKCPSSISDFDQYLDLASSIDNRSNEEPRPLHSRMRRLPLNSQATPQMVPRYKTKIVMAV